MKIGRGFGIGLLALSLLASACAGDRGSDESAGNTTGTTAADAGEGSSATFGDLPSPCGPGDASGSTDQGVTDETIEIGYGDDAGFAAQPGLNQDMSQAMEAMIGWCNDQGGINGRPIEGTYYDAKYTEVVNAYTDACAKEFFLVGELYANDDVGEPTRRECGLPAVPGSAVSAQLANGPLKIQPVPNPVDYVTVSEAEPLREMFPDEIQHAASVVANFPATVANANRVMPALEGRGWVFSCQQQYNVAGEADWKPFVQRLKDCGAQFVYFVGTANPSFQNLLQAADQLDFHPVWLTDQNNYDPSFAAWNTDGFADKVYLRIAFSPLDEGDSNPAVQQYLDLIDAAGGKPTLLGEASTSAFLLWATAAKACGSELTRDCVMSELMDVDDWTAGGLQASADPGGNLPETCGVLMKLTGTAFERVSPEEPGTYNCDDSFRVKLDGPDVDAANLDENRIAQL